MPVIKVEKTKDFTVMSNAHLRDRELTLKAKGLLSMMLSLPEGWDFTVEGLVSICIEGKDSIRGALQELENIGYLSRKQLYDGRGRFNDVEYTIYEHRQGKKPLSENPTSDNPPSEKPISENPPQYNTNNNQILNKSNIEEIKDIVEYLNLKTGSKFRASNKETQRHINARLREGYTVNDFKKVIDNKVSKWKNDNNMAQYLRPTTLFGSKFESYLNEVTTNTVSSSSGYNITKFDI